MFGEVALASSAPNPKQAKVFMTLAESILANNRLALSRLLTQIENNHPEGLAALNDLFPHTGRAALVGVTGAPGTGKSSLVNHLAHSYRHPTRGERPRRVAIIAVDPSSPFTGGAILGDRIRMRNLSGDPDIFIRSMASRGSLGGLARATSAATQVFDAAGYEVILIETVGAGQAEVDIARLAHTTLVVEAPGMGDEIQAIKAGILEIADILVINKADRPGVENTERALRSMLDLGHPRPHHHFREEYTRQGDLTNAENKNQQEIWIPPILRTVSTEGTGIEDLVIQIEQHQEYLQRSGGWQQREQARLRVELHSLLEETLLSRWRSSISEADYQITLEALFNRKLTPQEAVERLTQTA
jgi:LAO/AO transport system kinase